MVYNSKQPNEERLCENFRSDSATNEPQQVVPRVSPSHNQSCPWTRYEGTWTSTKLVRNAIDDAMVGYRDYPTERTRRDDEGLVRMTSLIDEDHEHWLREEGVSFPQFVDDVIQDRVERERELDEGQ